MSESGEATKRPRSTRGWDVLVGAAALSLCTTTILAFALFRRAPLAMMLLAVSGWVPMTVVWAKMLADAIRCHLLSHRRSAAIWHGLLLLMPAAAVVYYLTQWRPRMCSGTGGNGPAGPARASGMEG
jgi:hypothetical protein